MKEEKRLGEDSAFPIRETKDTESIELGMSKRFYAACAVKDDFDKLSLLLQERIVGQKVPRSENRFTDNIANIDIWSVKYAEWLAIGRAKWRYMQVDALLAQEEAAND